ncbi:MAG: hypothetical protein QM602_07430 [Microbacterium sp.]
MRADIHDPDEAALTALLERAAPATPFADAVDDDALLELVRVTRGRNPRRRATARAVAFGTIIALALGGAGIATARTLPAWEWWAQAPDSTMRFTLPSGAECEHWLVVRGGADAGTLATVQEYLRTTDLVALADVRSELARVVASDVVVQGEDGDTTVPAIEHDSEDKLYFQAMTGAILNVVWDELEARGIVDAELGSNVSFSSQADCPGAAW